MKIELQIPFSLDYKSGYLLTNKEPRRVVCLVGLDNKKTSISYARYLYCCSVGYYISDEFEVDHIDDNRLNDVIENLQLLSRKDNNLKRKGKAEILNFICPICNKKFTLSKQRSYGRSNPTCSKVCGGKKSHIKISNTIFK